MTDYDKFKEELVREWKKGHHPDCPSFDVCTRCEGARELIDKATAYALKVSEVGDKEADIGNNAQAVGGYAKNLGWNANNAERDRRIKETGINKEGI